MEGYGKRVLVVDDEESVRGLVAAVLEQAGYRVHVAADGVAALAEMKKRRFDAVISDYRMPRLDGEQFLLLSRLMWPKVPVLLLSADLTELPPTLQNQGVSVLVPKPFDSQRLLQALHESVSLGHAESPPDHVAATRMIHEHVCCDRGQAAATSLPAEGASQQRIRDGSRSAHE